jgi:hypothetical protein
LRELVVAGGDASPILEPAEAPLDNVALLIGFFVQANLLLAVGFARDDGLDAVGFEKGPDRVGVVAFISDQFPDAGNETDAFLGHRAICGVSRREDERPRPTELIDDGVDFTVAAAFRDADRLMIRPPFPPLAQRWILM